jgi:hypothetical protein
MCIHTSLNAHVECMKIECAAGIKNGFFAPSVVEHLGVARDALLLEITVPLVKTQCLLCFFKT